MNDRRDSLADDCDRVSDERQQLADAQTKLETAWKEVKNGEPVLVDVLAQPRSP